jgi:outer membrane protein
VLKNLLLSSVALTVLMVVPMAFAQAQSGEAPPPPNLMDDLGSSIVPSMPPEEPVITPSTPVPVEPTITTAPIEIEKPVVKVAKKKKTKSAKTAEVKPVEESVIDTLIADVAMPNVPDMPLTDALREAYLNNPTLRAARADVKRVAEAVPQALASWQPNVNATGTVEYGRTSNDPGSTSDGVEKTAGVDVNQPLYRGGRTLAGTRAAEALIDAQLAYLATTERSILFATAQAYMDLVKDEASVKVNERNRDVIDRQLTATRDRFRVGDVTRTDVAQSEFRLAQAEADLTTSIGALRSSRALFEQLVGQPAGKLWLPEAMFKYPASVDDAVTMAETYNPDVIAAMAKYQAARENVDVIYGELLPTLSAVAGTSYTMDPVSSSVDNRTSSNVGLRLTMPLYEGGAVRSRVREAKYSANELSIRILESRRAAREEAVRSWETLSAAGAELISRESQVRAAQIARDGVRQEADVGERTILDALDADREVRDAEIALITAKRNHVVAQFALASSLGLLVPGNVGVDQPIFDFNAYRKNLPEHMLSLSIDEDDAGGR